MKGIGYEAFFDGACAFGNPSEHTGAGAVLYCDGISIADRATPLGPGSNNTAEWSGLVSALELALEYEADTLTVYGDSQLVIYQMTGKYRVKKEDLVPYRDRAAALAAKVPGGVRFEWVRREFNTEADRLSKVAIEGAYR